MAVSLKENNCFFVTDQTPRPIQFNLSNWITFFNLTGTEKGSKVFWFLIKIRHFRAKSNYEIGFQETRYFC
jgi:hypothetical protein